MWCVLTLEISKLFIFQTGSTSTLCSSTRFARPKKFYHLDSPGAELAAARIKIENLSAEVIQIFYIVILLFSNEFDVTESRIDF